MSRGTWRRRAEQADDYTPATDLVFSMFAMSVLLLAILGAGRHVKEKGPVVIFTPPPPVSSGGDLKKAGEDIKKAEALISQLQSDLTSTRRQLSQTQAKIDYATIQIGAIDEASSGPIMASDTALSPRVGQLVIARIAAKASDIAVIRANRILFEIGTSADEGLAPDGTDLAMKQTMTWGEALLRRLRDGPLPPGCLAVMPTGKLHAIPLNRRSADLDGADVVRNFDAMLSLNPLPKEIRDEINRTRGQDRRIIISASSIAGAACSPQILAQSLLKLTSKAR